MPRHTRFVTAGTLFVGLLLPAPVSAQQPAGALPQLIQVGTPADGIFFVAGNGSAQKEVGMDGEVAAKVQGVVRDYENEMNAARESDLEAVKATFALEPEERRKKVREIRDQRTASVIRIKERYLPQLEGAVTPAQHERLWQIAIQAVGSEALVEDARLVKSLDLTDAQIQEISAICAEYRRLRLDRPRDQSDLIAKQLEKNKERDDKAESRLSKSQQEKLKELKGKPFDVSLLRVID